jgi:proteasome accessory factor B
MSRRKTERLLGLVVCLLSSPRYLTAVQIRAAVPGYPESFEAFKRMFERDKEELRELGIPLETGFNSPGDDEAGYRIPRQAYVLPEIRLEPDEAAVLSLAARVWRQAELAGAAAGALLKLRAAGVDASGEETAQPGIEPRLLAGEAAFGPLWEAVRDGRPVTFAYRAAGRSEPQQRHLQPWGVAKRHGRWYVAGYDTDRDAARVFRLSRIEGEVGFTGPAGSVIVPEGTDVRETVREWDTQPPAQQRAAILRVREGAGYGIRRYATPVPGSADVRASTGVPASADGWETISVPFSDVGWFAEHLASFGTDVVALEPADLREAVITQLKGALA